MSQGRCKPSLCIGVLALIVTWVFAGTAGVCGACAASGAAQAELTPEATPLPVRVQLQFAHVFGSEPLRIDDVSLRTSSGNTLSVSRMSYFVSNVTLMNDAGKSVPLADAVEFICAASSRTTMTLPAVPPGTYTSVDFDIGVAPTLNHADPATFGPNHALNPMVNNQHWGWQGGYVFIAAEGRWVKPDDSLGGYSFHIATDELLTRVSIPAKFVLSEDTAITLQCDVAKLFDGAHRIEITSDEQSQSTHSGKGDMLAPLIAKNLPRMFSFLSLAKAGEPQASAPAPAVLPPGTTPYDLKLPSHFPQPKLPLDNPLTIEGVELGKRLFFDTLLSADNSQSCASCHVPAAAFSDPRALSVGINGKPGSRNSMPLFNLAWSSEVGFTWDGRRSRLRDQVLAPIEDEREMHQSLDAAVAKLSHDDRYPQEFAKAFGSPGINAERLGLAVEQYLLTLISANSRFDQALEGKVQFTPQEKRGLLLFVTEHDPARGQFGADCFHCHSGNLFTDFQFRSNGLDIDSQDTGRQGVTALSKDIGRFKTPSLRNIDKTAPYMHDGRFETLLEVLDHYSEHVQSAASLDPNLAKHVLTTPDGQKKAGVSLPQEDKDALVAFLKTLTEEEPVVLQPPVQKE